MRGITKLLAPALAGVAVVVSPVLGQNAESGRIRAPHAVPSVASSPAIAGDERWDARFRQPHPGIDGTVYTLALDGSGGLYAGGAFATAGGTPANNVARWSNGMWLALGLGLGDQVNTLTLDAGGNLYAGGFFTTAGGAAAKRVARWNGASWSALGAGVGATDSESVSALAVDGGGSVYTCGDFDTPFSNAAAWNGASWSALGTRTVTNALVRDGSGNLIAAGS